MKRLMTMMMAVLLTLGSVTALAADAKIGVVNLRKVIDQAPQAGRIKTDLQTKFKPREEAINKANQALQADIAKLKKEGAVMSAAQKQTLQDKISNAGRELQFKQQALQQDAGRAQNEAMRDLLKNISDVVNQVAKKDNYDIVLQEENTPFVNKKLDITEKVITILKKQS